MVQEGYVTGPNPHGLWGVQLGLKPRLPTPDPILVGLGLDETCCVMGITVVRAELSLVAQLGKNPPAVQRPQFAS